MAEGYKLTEDDCRAILAQHLTSTDFEIVSFAEKSISNEVEGLMGGHNRLYITARVNNEPLGKSFFLKRMRTPSEAQSEMIRVQGAYEKEYFIYKVFNALFAAVEDDKYKCDFMTACYMTVSNDLLVFEDMSVDGFISNKSNTYLLDVAHLAICLDSLAKFHAGSIIHESRQSATLGRRYKMTEEYGAYLKEPLYRRDDEYLGNKMYKSFTNAVVAIIDHVPQFDGRQREMKSKFLTYVDRLYELVKESDTFCNVICHGDLWTGNVLFKYVEDVPVQCKIIDFQALRYTVPAHDFLSLVVASSRDYGQHIDALKEHYYKCLTKHLAENGIDINARMTYEQFEDSIEHTFPFIIVQRACFTLLNLFVYYSEIKNDGDSLAKFLFDDMTQKCLKGYQEFPGYRNFVNSALADLDKLP